jgi:hypothetical protein
MASTVLNAFEHKATRFPESRIAADQETNQDCYESETQFIIFLHVAHGSPCVMALHRRQGRAIDVVSGPIT